MKTWDDYKNHVKSLSEEERRNMENIENLVTRRPKALGSMTKEELTADIQASMNSIKAGRIYTDEEVDKILKEDFSKARLNKVES
ncbi:helix-turn-helix domain-containing protein [Acidaminococcus sp. LBK-2]|jgi:hypothetical protein|uniref:transcriptional regulator n=1 Tax=Acidaminococcus TaxID=904 RepID=UPI001E3FDC54|nr:transcriptional regulator [Acidaminococcus fermentans]